MRNEERLMVDGYLYGNEDDVKLAKEEMKTAEYLEARINYDDLQTTLLSLLSSRLLRLP